MEIALIPPSEYVAEYAALSDIDLILPRQWASDEAYRNAYQTLWSSGKRHVILDNGAAENEQPSASELMAIIEEVQPDEFALPDVLLDSQATLQRSVSFLENELGGHRGSVRLGFVAQGTTVAEAYSAAATWILQYGGANDIIFLPRVLTYVTHGLARIELAEVINSMFPNVEIHLFGMSNQWPGEMLAAAGYPFIRSIDSSLPFYNGLAYSNMYQHNIERPDQYFDIVFDDEQKAQVDKNVEMMRNWANGLTQTSRGAL